jgi:spermidine/putrescine transport system permease protein
MTSTSSRWRKALSLGSGLGPLANYMLIFFVIPIAVFFVYSFWRVSGWDIVRQWNLDNYREVFTSAVYSKLMLRSLFVGLTTAALSILVVYPFAYTLVFKFAKYRDLILFLLTISLFSNYLVRIYAWRSILSSNGLVNAILMALGLADGPRFYLLYSPWGVILTLLNVYIPFATLPIYSALLNVDRDIIDAAGDLGANPLRSFFEVTLPLSMPGVQVAFLFIFLLAAGDFVTPEMVGGKGGMLIGNSIATQFGMVYNWPLGSAMAFSMIVMVLVFFVAVQLLSRCLRRVR